MEQDDPTVDALAGGAHMTPADGGAAVISDSLTLTELNSALGKDFKDKDTALKAFKDTFSYVGKRKEDIEAEVRKNIAPAPQDSVSKSEFQSLQKQLFYTANPQFKDYQALIDSMGSNPAEVVQSDVFKGVFEKVKVADEEAQKRSVVNSSPRLAQAKSSMDEAVQIANSRASGVDLAEHLAHAINDEAQS